MDLTPETHARHLKDLETSVRRARQTGPTDWAALGRSLRAVSIMAATIAALYLTFGALA
jgi:hypothetical protein